MGAAPVSTCILEAYKPKRLSPALVRWADNAEGRIYDSCQGGLHALLVAQYCARPRDYLSDTKFPLRLAEECHRRLLAGNCKHTPNLLSVRESSTPTQRIMPPLAEIRKAPDTFNFLRHVMRAILSLRPKCSHRCGSLKETPLKPVQILRHLCPVQPQILRTLHLPEKIV